MVCVKLILDCLKLLIINGSCNNVIADKPIPIIVKKYANHPLFKLRIGSPSSGGFIEQKKFVYRPLDFVPVSLKIEFNQIEPTNIKKMINNVCKCDFKVIVICFFVTILIAKIVSEAWNKKYSYTCGSVKSPPTVPTNIAITAPSVAVGKINLSNVSFNFSNIEFVDFECAYNLQEIGFQAFKDNNIKEIEFKNLDNLSTIRDDAFSNNNIKI